MLDQMCMYLGQFHVLHLDNNVINVTGYECVKLKENTTSFFKTVFKCQKENTGKVQWFSVACVFNHHTKLKVMIVLCQLEPNILSINTCFHSETAVKLVEVENLSLESNFIAVTNVNIAVTDGPTILTIKGLVLNLYSVVFDLSKKFTLQALKENESIDHILQFDSYETDASEVIYIMIFRSVKDTINNVYVFCVIQNLDSGEFSNEIQAVSCNLFFPSYYEEIISAITIVPYYMSRNFKSDSKVERDCSIDSFFVNCKVICCTFKQFLMFQNACLKYCCDMDFNVQTIILPPSGNCWENKMFFLQSSVKGICIMRIEDNSNVPKCCGKWDTALRVYIGDFLQNCSQQILLLLQTDIDSWQEECIFLKLSSLSPMVIPSKSDVIPNEHLTGTVASLQKRVLYSKAAVVEAECRIAKKTSVIASLLNKSSNQCSKNLLPGQDPNSSLVDIITYKENSRQSCEEEHSCKMKAMALQVVDHWNIILMNHWFIGWTLQNVSDSCVTQLNASLSCKEGTVEYRQRIYIENSKDFSLSKVEKRHVTPGECISVTLGLEVPTFVTDCIHASCILSWNIGVSSNPVSDALFPDTIKGPCQQQPFEVSLSLEEVLNRNIPTNCSGMHQLMSIRTIQDCLLVEVSSTTSSITRLETLALQKQKSCAPQILEIEGAALLFFMDEQSPLFGINASWNPLSRNRCECEIYARSQKEMVLFIQWLYSILPCDVAILPKTNSEKTELELQKKLLVNLKDEVDLLHLAFTNPNKNQNAPSEKNVIMKEQKDVENAFGETSAANVQKNIIVKEIMTDTLMAAILSED